MVDQKNPVCQGWVDDFKVAGALHEILYVNYRQHYVLAT